MVDAEGRHSGGPFQIQVSPKMRVEELRRVIRVSVRGEGGAPRVFSTCTPEPPPSSPLCVLSRKRSLARPRAPPRPAQDKGGVIPALQRLSYAGKNLEDSQRTLEQ